MGQLFIITGDDDFARKERAREIIDELVSDPEDPRLEVVSGDAPDLKPEAIAGTFLESLRTPPFLTGEKVVWLRHFPDLDLFGNPREGSAAAAVAEYLSAPLPQEVSVVIDGPGFDLRRAGAKAIKKAGALVESFSTARPGDRGAADDRRAEVVSICQAAGKRIAADAVAYLIEVVGGDSGVLRNELRKLVCYIGGAEAITLADCQSIISRTPETVGWEYTAAIHAGKPGQALRLLDILLREREAEMRIISLLSNEFQKLIQTRLALRELGISRVYPGVFDAVPEEVRARYPDNPLLKMHPYRAFKSCEAAAGISDAELAEKVTLIRTAARHLVSGVGDRRMVLEQLTLKLAGRSSATSRQARTPGSGRGGITSGRKGR